MTKMKVLILILMYFVGNKADEIDEMLASGNASSLPLLHTRRILRGTDVGETRPYMVYLRAAPNVELKLLESHWLCGGVIIHERYILTSAACIEDAKHFFVISGTHRWIPPEVTDNECINNGAKKAVWKCVPKSYFFDGDDFDNIRWMVGDIAIVKVEDDFNFERRIRGCDFIPKKVEYNNNSLHLEKSATLASVAGWGTTERFVDTDVMPLRSSANSVELLETDVVVISKTSCKKRWDERYHFIINDEMICTKDSADDEPMSAACADREVNCKGLELSAEDYYDDQDEQSTVPHRRMIIDPRELQVHTAAHRDARRKNRMQFGGFCENDHGGPLIVGRGKSSMVIGIMSACHTREIDMKCYGPFLFTSVYKYRHLISCAIEKKSIEPACRRLLSTAKPCVKETAFSWPMHNEQPPAHNDHEKNIARNFEFPPPSSEEMAQKKQPPHPPATNPPPPRPKTTLPPTTVRTLPTTALPPLSSEEQDNEFSQKEKISKDKFEPYEDGMLSQARPPKLIEYDMLDKKQDDSSQWPIGGPHKMPAWLTDKNPRVDLSQAKSKSSNVGSDENEFPSIKKVIMRRFFNKLYSEK